MGENNPQSSRGCVAVPIYYPKAFDPIAKRPRRGGPNVTLSGGGPALADIAPRDLGQGPIVKSRAQTTCRQRREGVFFTLNPALARLAAQGVDKTCRRSRNEPSRDSLDTT